MGLPARPGQSPWSLANPLLPQNSLGVSAEKSEGQASAQPLPQGISPLQPPGKDQRAKRPLRKGNKCQAHRGARVGKAAGPAARGREEGGWALHPHLCHVLGLPHLPECAPSPARKESRSDGYTLPWGVKIIPAESRPVGWLGKGSNVLMGTSCCWGVGGPRRQSLGRGKGFQPR